MEFFFFFDRWILSLQHDNHSVVDSILFIHPVFFLYLHSTTIVYIYMISGSKLVAIAVKI